MGDQRRWLREGPDTPPPATDEFVVTSAPVPAWPVEPPAFATHFIPTAEPLSEPTTTLAERVAASSSATVATAPSGAPLRGFPREPRAGFADAHPDTAVASGTTVALLDTPTDVVPIVVTPARRQSGGRRRPQHAAPRTRRRSLRGDGGVDTGTTLALPAPPDAEEELSDRRATRAVARPRPRRRLMRRLGGVATTAATLLVSLLLFAAAGALFFIHLSIQPVLTGSMRPTYGPGWAVVSRSIPTTSVRPGMIVIFVPPGHASSYAHRVQTVKATDDGTVLTTKGDANQGVDPWHAVIKSTRIQQVVCAVPGFGQVMVWAKGPGMTVVLIVIAGLFVAVTGAKSIAKARSPKQHRSPYPSYAGSPR
jgi:signal peptidase